jgi:tetratricopeptide (TPR) repeat protein
MTEDRILQEAIKAIENGQRERARDLLTRLLRQDQSEPSYWLYMSAVVDTQKERIFCLENVLKYDPQNETALQGLVLAGGRPADDAFAPVRPLNERKLQVEEIIGVSDKDTAQKTGKKISAARLIPLLLVGIVAIGLIFVGIFGNPFYEEPLNYGNINSGGTQAPLFTSGPTPTYLPSSTPEGGIPTQDFSQPTPLVIRVEEKFTPTPRYVDTPHPNVEAYAAGLRSIDAGNYGQAVGLFLQAQDQIEDDPNQDDLDIQYYIALARLLNGEFEDAKREFDLILQEDSTFAAAYIGRAQAILSMRPNSNVAGDLYKAMGLDPDYLEAYLRVADYRLYNNEPEEALPVLENALELAPENADVLHYLAETYIALDRPEDALEAAQLSFDYNPLQVKNYRTLAQALILNGREAEAYGLIELYLRHEENKQDPLAMYLYGRAQQPYDMHEKAVSNFEKAYDITKRIYEMSNYWAISLIALGDYEKALERIQVPIERIPRWFEPYQVQAQIYYLLEQYEDAKDSIEEGAELARTDQELASLFYWRGKIYEDFGYPGISLENWEKLLELDAEEVPEEWLSEARERVSAAPTLPEQTPTPPEATQTRVPTSTPRP